MRCTGAPSEVFGRGRSHPEVPEVAAVGSAHWVGHNLTPYEMEKALVVPGPYSYVTFSDWLPAVPFPSYET